MRKRAYVGIALLVLAVAIFIILNIHTYGGRSIKIDSSYGEKSVTLKGTYYAAKGSEYAVLICPGYSCDRTKWRIVANAIKAQGISVMTFDYSGQGASYGTIGFDNAKTDSISVEIDDAIEKLHQMSGVDYEHIILLGHSMGGRSILRLLYDYNCETAETTASYKPIGNVILFSPEVNYHYNAQASLFAGTSDESQEPWKSYCADYIGATNVYIYGSTGDDIVSDADVLSIYSHIGGTEVPASGKFYKTEKNPNGTSITVGVTGGILHSYEMYSKKFCDYLSSSLSSITGSSNSYPSALFYLVYLGWFAALAGLFLLLQALSKDDKWTATDCEMQLTDSKKYLCFKLLMWLPGILAAFVVCCLCVVFPFGSPVMNIPYMCFVAGYGIVMFFAYRKGRFPGTTGKLPKLSFHIQTNKKETLSCLIASLLILFTVWFILQASMYKLIPLNWRLFYCFFAAFLMFLGYYISGAEADMLDKSGADRITRICYSIIQYIPLFALVIFYMALKSYSGMIGQIQNLLLMYILCVPLGEYIKKRTANRLIGALVTAFLFQTLMITSAALISLF